MGLWDRLTKSPEERLLNLMVEQTGKPGFSVSYKAQAHALKMEFSTYDLEAQRVEAIELAKRIDDKFGSSIDHVKNITVCTVSFCPHVSADLAEKYNAKLIAADKSKYVLSTKAEIENKPINSFGQLLSGKAKETLLFDYDSARGLLLVRQQAGSAALTGGETAFLMKLGKTVQTPNGVGVLIEDKAQARSYATSVSDMGGNIAETDLASQLPHLEKEQAQSRRIPDYLVALKDAKKADPMAWNVLARKEGEHSMRIIFKNEDVKDAFTAALPAGARYISSSVPDEVKKALTAKGAANVDDVQMLIVTTQEVVDQIREYFDRSRKPAK